MKKILITGGAGFIGSEFVKQSVKKGYKVIVVDQLTYAGDLARLKEIKGKIIFHKADICNKKKLNEIIKKARPEIVVHFAAESHVDRSILTATPFINTNVIGTQNLLDSARENGVQRFIHISTDEVYGDILKGQFNEASPFKPSSPYSVSKAAADLLVSAYVRTYNFPGIIVRPSNNYGPWQYPEKFIPVILYKALANEKIPVYAKGLNRREWLYVSDCASAILRIMEKGKLGEIYNVGSGFEKKNIDVVTTILDILKKPNSLIEFVKDRPGHDFRYSLDFSKVSAALGWRPGVQFEKGIRQTVQWYLGHTAWLNGKVRYLGEYWKKVYQSIGE